MSYTDQSVSQNLCFLSEKLSETGTRSDSHNTLQWPSVVDVTFAGFALPKNPNRNRILTCTANSVSEVQSSAILSPENILRR